MAVRKTATVLFCDLTDSTLLGEHLDAESLRVLLARWYDAMRAPIERHGGTVEKFIGDAVMAVFGVPTLHEDDALRAVRSALEMREGLERLNADLEREGRPQLAIRIGINSGEVVAGEEAATLVTGDPVNTAKRLEQAADAGEILIGAHTRRLVENAARLEQLEPIDAKGKSMPVEVWRVLATITDAEPFARRPDARLVGRTRERVFLHAELGRAADKVECRLVTILGGAGIGKSRLTAEFLNEVRREARVLSARCRPYGDGATFLPLSELIRSAGGEEAIVAAVAAEPDGGLVLERVFGTVDSTAQPATPEETFWAIRRMLEALAHERPLVVCLEDIHWAEPTFLDLVEYITGLSHGAPILLLCLARPELLEQRPHWGGVPLTLGPLTEEESAELIDELVAEWPLVPEAKAQVTEAAEGNPLFVEQLVAWLAEGQRSTMPPTIQALLAARLDQLEPLERAVLERAAVVGKEFSRGAVADLSREGERREIGTVLLRLVRKDFVRPEPSGLLGDDGFRFKHALIRDAAYSAMPKGLRSELHLAFVPWLEEHGGEDELVGYHLEQAYWSRADLGDRDEALANRAGEVLGEAGSRAAARGDAAAALSLLRRSLALLPTQHRSRVELLRELSAALWLDGDLDASELALSESIEAARARGDMRLEWYGLLERAARNAAINGNTEALIQTATRAVTVFEELDDALGLARAFRRIGFVAYSERRFADAARAFERALRHAEESGDHQERARSADALCTALLFGPARVDEAIARAEQILDSAEGNVVLRAHVSTSLAGLLAMRSDFRRARVLYREAGVVYDELGLRLPRVGWTEVVASIELLAGDAPAAVAALNSGYAVVDLGSYESLRARYAALLAFVLAGEGETIGAREFVRVCERSRVPLDEDSTARVRAAQALLAVEPSDAQRFAWDAVRAAERTDNLNLQATMRLVLGSVVGDAAESARARDLFQRKGNVAAASALDLRSLQI